jgi:hypothetical protein
MRLILSLALAIPAFAQSETAWELKNAALAARVAFDPGKGVALTSLVSARSGRQYLAGNAPSLLFHLKIRDERQAEPQNGHNPPLVNRVLDRQEYTLDGAGAWRLLASDRTDRDGVHLAIRLGRSAPAIELTLHLRCRPGASPLEVWYEVRNRGERTLVLDRFDSFNWMLSKAPLRNSRIHAVRKGTMRPSVLQPESRPLGSYTIRIGPVRDRDTEEFVPWFSIQRPGDDGGVYGGWAFSAFGVIAMGNANGDAGFRIGGGLDPEQLAIPVAAGESKPAPMSFLGLYEGSLDDGANELHRYLERWLAAPTPAELPLVNYNTWTAVGMNVTEANMLEHVRMAKALGCELFHIDAGWSPQAADWTPDPVRLPRGLLPIRNAAREAGMKFGLWLAFTQAGSALARSHPEWLTAPIPLNWQPRSYSGLTMCLAHEPARAHMEAVMEKTVSELQLDYLEHDQSILQTCRRDFHGHSPNAGTYEQTLAYYRLHEDLLRRHPNLLLENCMGGGNILDFGVLQRFHLFSLTDLFDPLANRQAIYGSTYPFPARYGEGYMKEAEGVSPHYQFRSFMMGYWSLSVDTTKWPAEKVNACKKDIAAYKRIRPILRHGNVYHILPRPDGRLWDGLEFYDPDRGQGVVFAFRPDSADSQQVVFLRGLDPAARYRVTFEDSAEAFVREGRALMTEGLRIMLKERFTSAIVYVDRT